jgi:hypothetical protein
MTAIRRLILMHLVLVLACQGIMAQESAASKEAAAANAVAKFVRETRERDGLPRLRRIKDGHLRSDGCRRAAKGDKSSGQSDGIGPPEKVGMLSVFWYSTLSPTQLPPELGEWAKRPDKKYEQPHRFAVGVCLTSTASGSEERYWIVVGTYMSAIKSILNIPTWD